MAKRKFTFIDLFAGIGGFRIALESFGGECVFSSEIDKYAQKTYEENFGEKPAGDITVYSEKDIPDHDILAAGFPCQAFSIAGKRKGIEDARGTLFFDIVRILKEKRPKAIILENVKGLQNHKSGKTLKLILEMLSDEKYGLEYFVPDPEILNAKNFGLAQNRERIFIIGFRKDLKVNTFRYPKGSEKNVSFKDVMEKSEVSVKFYLSDVYLETLKEHKRRHAAKGNGFGYEVIEPDEVANAIVVGGMGRERNLVFDPRLTDKTPVTNIKGEINDEYIRRMTPLEWKRLQGYPESYEFPVSDTQAYKQLGNSVPVPVVKAVVNQVLDQLKGKL